LLLIRRIIYKYSLCAKCNVLLFNFVQLLLTILLQYQYLMLVPYTLSRVMISGARSEHSFGRVLCPHFSVCLSVCCVRTLSPHQRVAPNENHKMKQNKRTSNNIFAHLALRYFCLFIQKQKCNYRESRHMLLTIVWGHYSS
jgi:hypothetical protein